MYNKATLIGFVARDPQYIDGDDQMQPLCIITLRVAEHRKRKDGTWRLQQDYIPCTAFGSLATRLKDRVRLGQLVMVEARIAKTNHAYDDVVIPSLRLWIDKLIPMSRPPEYPREPRQGETHDEASAKARAEGGIEQLGREDQGRPV